METDVVVVGGGGSGLAAALVAARAGRNVILLEKNSRLGGTTFLSVGSISVNRSSFQKALGIKDDPDWHFEDMGKFAGDLVKIDNLELRRLYVDNITETFEWLVDLGVVFHGPFEESPHRVSRMHLVLPNSRSYIKRLLKALKHHNVRIVTDARVNDLIVENGRVFGVKASVGVSPEVPLEKAGSTQTIEVRARKGVVLTSGDFSSNDELKERFVNTPKAKASAINSLSTGDGHIVATRYGAKILNGHLIWGPELRFPMPPNPLWATYLPVWPWLIRLTRLAFKHLPSAIAQHIMAQFLTSFLGPSPKLFESGALLLNEEGRVMDDLSSDGLSQKGGDQPFWIVFDAETADQFRKWPGYISTAPGVAYAYLGDYMRMRPDVSTEAPSIDALASKIGLNSTNVKTSFLSAKSSMLRAPFYALGPVSNKIVFTDGGLAVSAKMEVLDQSGKPISGLFAAGSAGQGGLILHGHGNHIGWAFLSGRIAGREASLAKN